MKEVKRLFVVVLTFLMAFCFGVGAFAYKIDGMIDSAEEWEGVPVTDVAQGADTGCDIEYLFVRYDFQPDKKVLYAAVQCMQYDNVENYENFRFDMTINDSDPITVTLSDKDYDQELYNVTTAFSQQPDGVCMEIRISFKKYVGSEIDFGLTVTDSEGNESEQFVLTMGEESDEQGTTKTSDNTSKTTTKKSAATKKTTTKKTTTKKSSSKKTKTTSSKYTTGVYSTVNPDDYTSANNSADNSSPDKAASSQTSSQNDTGKIILKTAVVGMIVVTSVAFVLTLRRKRKL